MSNPGPPGEDERPLAGPDAGMGLPESGTQHATSTDFALPLDPSAEPHPLAAGDGPVGGTPPPARPAPPAYDDPSELVDPVASADDDPAELVDPATPAYDEPTDLLDAVPDIEATELAAPASAGTPAYDALAAESGFDPADPTPPGGGVLAAVKTFADQRPAAFLAAALLAGWLVGKLLGSSGGDDDDEG